MKQAIPKRLKHHARIASLALVTWASIGLVGGISARSHKVENRPVIRVRIYNYAYVHGLELRDAERQAAFLFARAGVRIEWTVYSQKRRSGRHEAEDSGTDFVLRIVPASMAARLNHKTGEAGQSLIPSGVHGPTPGGIAHVFYESVRDLASDSGAFIGEALGDAMAHELGHLLLGSGHSSAGVMKARWTVHDLRIASQGGLPFSQTEVVLLQHAALSLKQDSEMMVARR